MIEKYNIKSNRLYFLRDSENDMDVISNLINTLTLKNAISAIYKKAKWKLNMTCDESLMKEICETLTSTTLK